MVEIAQTTTGRDGRLRWAGLVVLIGTFLVLRVPPLLRWSPTYDEPIYVGAGSHWLKFGDDRIAPLLYHPPLSFYATSLLAWSIHSPLRRWDERGPANQIGIGVIYESRSRSGDSRASERTVLVIHRLPMLLLGLAGLALAYRLGRTLGGPCAGWILSFAYAAHPEMAAECAQATTDLAAVLGAMLLALAGAHHLAPGLAERPWRPTLATGLASGAALLCKHSLLVCVLALPVLLFAVRLLRARRGIPVPPCPLARLCAASLLAFVTVWSAYRFELKPIASSVARPHAPAIARITGIRPEKIDCLLERVPVPAAGYLRSAGDALLDKGRARKGTPWVAYLNGCWSPEGFLAYFPIALAVKTPVSLLALLLLGILGLPALARRAPSPVAVCLLFTLLLFAGPVFSRLNIGVRHVAPATMLALAVGSAAAARLVTSHHRFATWLLAGLAALLVIEWIPSFGQPLSFANLPAGGPVRLHRVLADSNLEHGQDLWAVEDWARRVGASEVCSVLMTAPGLIERERLRHPFLRIPAEYPDWKQLVEALPRENQQAEPSGRAVLALGETHLAKPQYRPLWDIPPHVRIGATRIYLLPR